MRTVSSKRLPVPNKSRKGWLPYSTPSGWNIFWIISCASSLALSASMPSITRSISSYPDLLAASWIYALTILLGILAMIPAAIYNKLKGGSRLAPPYDYLLKAQLVAGMGVVGLCDSPVAVLCHLQRCFNATAQLIALSSVVLGQEELTAYPLI